jgi:hypothetical protein
MVNRKSGPSAKKVRLILPPAASLTNRIGWAWLRTEVLAEAFERRWFARRCAFGEYRPATNLHTDAGAPNASSAIRNMCSRRDRARRAGACLFSDLAKERRKRCQPALLVERLANASRSQTDDIRAHRQQNGDAYSDNDQEEFAHCSVSRRSQRNAAGMVLCWPGERSCVRKWPAIEAGLRKSRWDRDQIATP